MSKKVVRLMLVALLAIALVVPVAAGAGAATPKVTTNPNCQVAPAPSFPTPGVMPVFPALGLDLIPNAATVFDSAGRATYTGTSGGDAVYVDYDNPFPTYVTLLDGNDMFCGGPLKDVVWGNAGNDVIYLNEGDDKAYGGDGNDWIFGGSGDDKIRGNADNDSITGDTGDDMIWGKSGQDILYGEAGDDNVRGGDGNDIVFGGGELNYNAPVVGAVAFSDGAVALGGINEPGGATVAPSDTYLDGDDKVAGGAGHDVAAGGTGADKVYGGTGNDCLSGGLASLTLAAGSVDAIAPSIAPNFVDLAGVVASACSPGLAVPAYTWGSLLVGAAWFAGGNDNPIDTGAPVGPDLSDLGDTIKGGAGNDEIHGDEGADTIEGGANNDYIVGGNGNDSISCGSVPAGIDADYVRSGGGGFDTSMDDCIFELSPAAGADGTVELSLP